MGINSPKVGTEYSFQKNRHHDTHKFKNRGRLLPTQDPDTEARLLSLLLLEEEE